MKEINVLIPTFERSHALAVTLSSLCSQTFKDFNIIISDQSKNPQYLNNPPISSLFRVLKTHGSEIKIFRNLPRKGIGEQRQFLLQKSKTPYSLFLDDDLILEPFVTEGMLKAIKKEKCGFVGRGVIGLSFENDVRPNQQTVKFWKGKVKPERITPEDKKWKRHLLHNAANLWHVEKKLNIKYPKQKKYKVAWVGGCVLYDTEKLKSVGGFSFWNKLPKDQTGEDVLAELKVMEKYGGCALMPSGVYHQELTTTLPNRNINAPEILQGKI